MQLNFEGKALDEIAIEHIRQYEPTEGYALAFSGGKDSVVVHHLAERAGVKFEAKYFLTTVDPPELVKFVKAFGGIQIIKPRKTMWRLVEEMGMLPQRQR